MELQRELATDKNLTPSGRHSWIVFGILPREDLLCGAMNFLHLQLRHTWLLASLADLCLVVWPCGMKFPSTPFLTYGWIKIQTVKTIQLPSAATSQATLSYTLLLPPCWPRSCPWPGSTVQTQGLSLQCCLPGISPPSLPLHIPPCPESWSLGIFPKNSSIFICPHSGLSFSSKVLTIVGDTWFMSLCEDLMSVFATWC